MEIIIFLFNVISIILTFTKNLDHKNVSKDYLDFFGIIKKKIHFIIN